MSSAYNRSQSVFHKQLNHRSRLLPVLKPKRINSKRLAALSIALLMLGLLLGLTGCTPGDQTTDTATLLPPDRENIQYRTLMLPNQLEVMLVSNPSVQRSAAALSVGVGSLSNPENRPGLVHFLEHMLFLGTSKYPDADAYSKFMASHNGGGNAYTADDHTNYFFEVAPDALDEALDRFSQFFVAPLFDQQYAERELNAVDSEHAKNLENDYWRIQQVLRSHYKAGHPINRFSTGNLKTLRGVGNEELKKFYREYYSSNLMKLAVVGNQSLDALEKMVRGRFDQVPNQNVSKPSFAETFLETKPVLRVIRVEPIKDERRMQLLFPLPSVSAYRKEKPLNMIAFVLGHEGKGSLLSLLKRKNLAHSLGAGIGEHTEDYAAMSISIGLTPKGLKNWKEVTRLVLAAIRALEINGIPKRLYEENRAMSELNYNYKEQEKAGSTARGLSALMQSYPAEELPKSAYLLQHYDEDLYKRLLARITPDNMLVTLVTKGQDTDKTEPVYGTRYAYQELAGENYQILAKTRQIKSDELAAQGMESWSLPEPNPFLPSQLDLLAPEGPLKLAETSLGHLAEDGLPAPLLEKLKPLQGQTFTGSKAYLDTLKTVLEPEQYAKWAPLLLKDALALPVRLMDTELAKVWYLPDWRQRKPKAAMYLMFHTEGASATPKAAMLNNLYTVVLAESLNEYGYPIREAGLDFSVGSNLGGLQVSLQGYSDRMPDLLEFLVKRLRTAEVDAPTFASLKERLVRNLENSRMGQPYEQSRYFSRLLLTAPRYDRESLLKALRAVTLADLKAYAAGLLHRTYLKGVVVGNLDKAETKAGIEKVFKELGSKPLPESQRVKRVVRDLPNKADWVFSDRLPINNSLVNLYYQVGKTDPRLRGAMLIVSRHLGQTFYHNMRTQQQLGYIVWAGMSQIEKTLGLNFLVQSGQYPADVLLKRVQSYLPQYLESFAALPPPAFEKYRVAVNKAKLTRPKSISETAENLYWVAFENNEKWSHVSEDREAVKALTQAEVKQLLEQYLTGAKVRRMVIRLIGRDHAESPVKGQALSLPRDTYNLQIQGSQKKAG